MKKHNANRAAAILRERRRANAKRTISTHVAKVARNEAARKAVTAALRTNAKKLRESGALGRVQTRVGHVGTEGRVGVTYRYTSVQLAMIATVYRPRKEEYKAVRAELIAA
jgi:hypothetical protein